MTPSEPTSPREARTITLLSMIILPHHRRLRGAWRLLA
jgi:hypothetical protein